MSFSPSDPKQAFVGFARPLDQANPFNAQWFLIQQALGSVFTAALVVVRGVSVEPPTVDVQILVNQVDGLGQGQEHGIIYGVGYGQVRAGASAVIITPVVGDIGIAVFAMRDSSVVQTTRAPGLPGSARRNDPADALYVCGLAGGTAPTQFVELDPTEGITVKSTVKVRLEAPTCKVVADTCEVVADVATITADTVNLGGTGGAAVARVGDSVSGGVITSGSSKVKAA